MFDGPRGEAHHLIGVRTFAPNDRDGLESLKSDLEAAASRFQEYIDDAEAYGRAIHRFRHPDWPDDARAKFKVEIERLRPIVERQPTLPPSIYNCLSDSGRSMLKTNESLISKKAVLAELRYLHRETSDAQALILSRQPLSPPTSAEQPTNDVKPNEKTVEIAQPVAVAAAGNKSALTPGARAVAAAYDLQKEGKPTSLRAVCDRANVDRAHLRYKYPEAVDAIRRMKAPGRTPRRGVRDKRTNSIEAADDFEDLDSSED